MKKRISHLIVNYWHIAAILIIIIFGWRLRLTEYGDPRLSIGTNDSNTYVESSSHFPFSWASFTSRRPFTIAVLYRLLQPEKGYDLYHITNPAAEKQIRNRVIQPGLDRVVIFHMILSMISWAFLAIAISRHLNHKIIRVFSAALIMVFAFSPQTVDWDSILSSESLAISFFVLMFAFLIEIAFWLFPTNFQSSIGKFLLLAGWLSTVFLWIFVRDTHVYAVLVILLLLLPFIFLRQVRNSLLFNSTFILLSIFTAFSLATTKASDRWSRPFLENIIYEIKPFPKRMEFFQERGMPDPHSKDFYSWAKVDGIKVYTQFLLFHPGYVSLSMLEGLESIVSENIQPYFRVNAVGTRAILVSFGNLVHPKSSAIFLVSLILLICLVLLSFRNADLKLYIWTWLGVFGFLAGTLMLFISYFGDAAGRIRHTLGAVLIFRLFLWVLLMVIWDSLLQQSDRKLSHVYNFLKQEISSIFHFTNPKNKPS